MSYLTVESRGIFKLNIRYQKEGGQAFSIGSVSKYPRLLGRLFKWLKIACALKIDKKIYYVNAKSFLKHAAKVDQLKTDGLSSKKLKKIDSALIDTMTKSPGSAASVHLHLGPIVIVSNTEIAKKDEEGEVKGDGVEEEKPSQSPSLQNPVSQDPAPEVSSTSQEAREAKQRRERLLKLALGLYSDEDLISDNSSPDYSSPDYSSPVKIEEVQIPSNSPENLSLEQKVILEGGYTFTGVYEKEKASSRIIFKKGVLQSKSGTQSWEGEWKEGRLYNGTFVDIAVGGKDGLMKIDYLEGKENHKMVRTKSRKFALSQWFNGMDGKILERFKSSGDLISIRSTMIGKHFDEYSDQVVDPLPQDGFFEVNSLIDAEGFFTQDSSWKFHKKSARKNSTPDPLPNSTNEMNTDDLDKIEKGVLETEKGIFEGYYQIIDEGHFRPKCGTYRSKDYSWVYDGGWGENAFTGYLYQVGSGLKREKWIDGTLHKKRHYEGSDIKVVTTYAIEDSEAFKKGDPRFVKVYDRESKKLLEVTYFKNNEESYRLSGSFNDKTKLEGLGSETLFAPIPLKFRGEFAEGLKEGEFRIIHREKGLLAIANYARDKIVSIQLGPFDEEGKPINEGLFLSYDQCVQYLADNLNKVIEDEVKWRYQDTLSMILLYKEAPASGVKIAR